MTISPASYGSAPGPGLLALVGFLVGGMLLLAVGLRSDLTLASSRRHLYATIVSGFFLVLGGISFPFLSIPLFGNIPLPLLGSLLLTIAWVFLLVSIMELCSVLPVLAYLLALLVGLPQFIGVPVFQSFTGAVLCGALVGCVPGRIIGGMLAGTHHPLGKAEVLVLGYTAAAATLASYMKSFTAVTFVLPVGLIVIVIILMSANQFDRTLILRASPREE